MLRRFEGGIEGTRKRETDSGTDGRGKDDGNGEQSIPWVSHGKIVDYAGDNNPIDLSRFALINRRRRS